MPKSQKNNGFIRPFLKWAGGKYRVMPLITPFLTGGKQLVEPFVGGGAVFLNTEYDSYILADVNKDLIDLYLTLKEQGSDFIDYAELLFNKRTNVEKKYYELREEFNSTENSERKAALFLYLNRHGYNGLCRYNASGGFNVPFGRYVKPYFPRDEMHHFHKKSKARAKFLCSDFRAVMKAAKKGAHVYCDPPYFPLSETASFTSYSRGGFTDKDQLDLAKLAASAEKRGVKVLISNHDTKKAREIYHAAKPYSLTVKRFISCNGKNRKDAAELLVLYDGNPVVLKDD